MPQINSVAGQLVGIPVGQVYTAGPGIKIDNVNKTVSVDETVLWEGTLQGSNGGAVNLVERVTNFERIRITYKWNASVTEDVPEVKEVVGQEGIVSYFDAGYSSSDMNKFRVAGWIDFRTQGKMSIITAGQDNINGTAMGYHGSYGTVYKVVGINRIQSA